MCPQVPRRCGGSHTHVPQCCHACHPLSAVICGHSTPPGCMATPMAPLHVSPPREIRWRQEGMEPLAHPMRDPAPSCTGPILATMEPPCPCGLPWPSSTHPGCPQCTPAFLNAPWPSSMHPGCCQGSSPSLSSRPHLCPAVPIFVRPDHPHHPVRPARPTGPYQPLSHSLSRTLVCFYYPSLLGTLNSP